MPSCQVFSAKSKAYEELEKWQSWLETYEADEIVNLCPDPKTMRISPSKPLRRSLNDSARYTWYSARRKAHSAHCKYVARATLSVPVRTCTVAHFSDLSDSVFACVLGWMSNRECF